MQRSESKLGRIIVSLETDIEGFKYNERFQVYQGILFKKVDNGERDWRLVCLLYTSAGRSNY